MMSVARDTDKKLCQHTVVATLGPTCSVCGGCGGGGGGGGGGCGGRAQKKVAARRALDVQVDGARKRPVKRAKNPFPTATAIK